MWDNTQNVENQVPEVAQTEPAVSVEPEVATPVTPEVVETKKSGKAKFALIVGAILCLVFVGVGTVITVMNANSKEEIATTDLEEKVENLRKDEVKALETSGFSDSFYEALGKTSEVMDDIYEAEDAADGAVALSMWQILTKNGAIIYYIVAVVVLVAGVVAMMVLKKKEVPVTMVATPLAVMAIVLTAGYGMAARAETSSGGAINSISLADFMKETDYIRKLVPGSDEPTDPKYYGNDAFQNSVESHAVFDLESGGQIQVYEDQTKFKCDMLGVKNYMVDFTGAKKDFTKVNRTGGVGGTNAGKTDVRTRAEKAAMMQNAIYLQLVEYCAAGKNITITIPKGEYYFAVGHHVITAGEDHVVGDSEEIADNPANWGESYVILPVNNVNISGRGIGDYKKAISSSLKDGSANAIDEAAKTTNGSNATILKPYTRAAYDHQSAPDMFRFNDYKDRSFYRDEQNILKNVSYRDFIVDGEDAVGWGYTSAGKGFMYNVFENVNWDNMVVKNTDGTGFGIDCPIGSGNYIRNSLAVNNGKKADTKQGGASGFGIGVGYQDNEKFEISKSIAYGNTKFGFFFEHQNRFQSINSARYAYDAIMGAGNSPIVDPANLGKTDYSRKAFTVADSLSVKNLYNYGGERAFDMSVTNSTSVSGSVERNKGTYYAQTTTTASDVWYSGDSRRLDVKNVNVKKMPNDVQDSSKWYYDAVKWAYENGISYGVSTNTFGVGQQIRRSDAIMLLWRMAGNPGEVVTRRNGTQAEYARDQYVLTCFSDVEPNDLYAGAIKWAYYDRYDENSSAPQKGRITVGTKACDPGKEYDFNNRTGNFDPNKTLTRAEFVTMLWRLAGSPKVNRTSDFEDIPEGAYYEDAANWAAAKGITMGIGDNKFAPHYDCTREQAITFLYRYAKL